MPSSSKMTLKSGSFWVLLWPLLALGALLLYNAVFTDGFFHLYQQDGQLRGILVDILKNGAPVILVALGMTLVLATGGVDLSVGAVMVIAGAKVAMVAGDDPSQSGSIRLFLSAIFLAMGFSLIAGIWNVLLVSVMRVQPIVATLILMVAGASPLNSSTMRPTPGQKHRDLVSRQRHFSWLALPYLAGPGGVSWQLSILISRRPWASSLNRIRNSRAASRYAGLKFHPGEIQCLCGCCPLCGPGGHRSAPNVRPDRHQCSGPIHGT